MKKKQVVLLISLIVIFAAIIFTSPLLEGEELDNSMQENDFTLENLEDQEIKLSDYAGKIIILDFMGTDCPTCEDAIPVLKEIKQQYGEEVVILSIAIESKQQLRDFKSQHNANWQFLRDPDGKVFQDYVETYIPTIVIFDKNGEMIYKKEGGASLEIIEEKIQNNV